MADKNSPTQERQGNMQDAQKKKKLFDANGKISYAAKRDLKKTEMLRSSHGFTSFDPDLVREKLQQVSWGFAEDAENEIINKEDEIFYEEALDLNKLKQRTGLTDKQKKFIRQLEDANKKVGNFEKELENLRKKSELSHGQNKRVEQLNDRLEEIIGERDMLEEKLRSSFFDSHQPFKKKFKGQYDYSSDEDEFYDRAKKNINQATNLSTEELQDQLGKLLQERLNIVAQIEKNNQEEIIEDEDPLEAYMNENSESLKKENLDKLAIKLRELNTEIDKIYALKPGIAPKTPITQPENIQEKPEEEKIIREGPKKRIVYGAEEKAVPRDEQILRRDLDFYDENEEWEPPEDQSGDGKTNLNDKYGY